MDRKLIVRADDFDSARAANAAILEAVRAGYLVRNVSCMAPGPYLDEGADALVALAHRVDIGLHLTVNAEWDAIKWAPCAPPEKIPALLNEKGEFYPSGEELAAAGPPVEQVLCEANAQLERITKLGLPVSYLDGHMFPDRFVPGLGDALRQWCAAKGLRYAMDFDPFFHGGPAFSSTYEDFARNTRSWLANLPELITLYIIHPAKHSPETCSFCNSQFPAGVVAWERELEYRSATNPVWQEHTETRGLQLLRFRDTNGEDCHGIPH